MAFLRDSSLYCIPNSTFKLIEKHSIGGICMATSSVGFLGAALQIKSLWKYRDRQRRRPSPNPSIIFYLALSDLIACIGVFTLAICFALIKLHPPIPEKPNKNIYIPSHQLQYVTEFIITSLEVITLFSYLASYIWTFSYSLDMYFQIIQIECPMIVYHILAWLFPLDLVACIEGINFGIYGSGKCQYKLGQMSRLSLSYFLVLVVIIGNPLLLLLTYRKIKQLSRFSGIYTNADRIALTRFKRKLFLMVFVFTICWLPNIISVCYDLVRMSKLPRKKQYKLQRRTGRFYLVYIEAFFNPLQGMFNYLIYRNAFKVTATDTRLDFQNSLTSVTYPVSWMERLIGNHDQNRRATNKTVQKITISPECRDEKTQSISSSNKYSYVSRLLGE